MRRLLARVLGQGFVPGVKRSILLLVAGTVVISAVGAGSARAGDTTGTLETDSGDFVGLIAGIKSHMPSQGSNGYRVPTAGELRKWETAIQVLQAGRLSDAASIVAAMDYKLVEYTDQPAGALYLIFMEQEPITRGWGTYAYNPNHERNIHIHVDHPVFDLNTYRVGSSAFRELGAEWFFMAGTHRYANPNGESDMARAADSVFQTFHEQLLSTETVALSIHGFSPAAHDPPISRSDIILSAGQTSSGVWEVPEITLTLRDAFVRRGYATAVAFQDPGFLDLSGGINPQGQYANETVGFGHWIHIELTRSIRETSMEYLKVVDTLAGFLGPVLVLDKQLLGADTGSLRPGDVATYTVTMENVGYGTQPDNKKREFVDKLDTRVEVVDVTVTSGDLIVRNGNVVWNGSIGPRSSETVIIQVRVRASATGRFCNRAVAFVDTNSDGANSATVKSNRVCASVG